jgi:hypothetical protein
VQEYAKEALDTLHAAPGTQTSDSFTSTGLGGVGGSGKRMQGFGNDSGIGNSSSSSSGMMGFGSDSVGYQYGGGGGGGGRDVGSNAPSYRAPISGGPGGGGGAIDLSGGGAVLESLSYGVRDLADRAVEAMTRPEHQRLNSVDSEDSGHGYGIHNNLNLSSNNTGNLGGGGRAPVMLDRRDPGLSPSTSSQQQQQQQQHQSREYCLVERICIPSGMRAAPSSEDLHKFVEATATLDGVELALALQRKLEIGSWQEKLRALCAIEALLEKSSTSPTAGEVAVHFQSEVGVLRRAQQSTQATVRQRAQRVLKLLGADTLPEDGTRNSSLKTTALTTTTTAGATQDLLGGGDLFTDTAPTAISGTSYANAMDLLAGLTVAPEHSGGSDIFGDWADSTAAAAAVPTTAPAPAPVAPAGGIDLLDALTDLSISQPTPVHTSTAAMPAMHTTGPLDDIFSLPSPATMTGGMTSTGGAGGGAPSSNGLLGISQMQYQPPGGVFNMPGSAGQHQLPVRTASLGLNGSGGSGVNDDVLRAINAATSGITSTKREEVAFDFVTTAMAQLKTKK